jgi:hypothetical protein
VKKAYTIYSQGEHRWHVTARDPDRPGYVIDTNEYLVSHGEHGLLTDPGGMEIFPAVFAGFFFGGMILAPNGAIDQAQFGSTLPFFSGLPKDAM